MGQKKKKGEKNSMNGSFSRHDLYRESVGIGVAQCMEEKSEGMDEHVSTCKTWEGISCLAYISGRGLCTWVLWELCAEQSWWQAVTRNPREPLLSKCIYLELFLWQWPFLSSALWWPSLRNTWWEGSLCFPLQENWLWPSELSRADLHLQSVL